MTFEVALKVLVVCAFARWAYDFPSGGHVGGSKKEWGALHTEDITFSSCGPIYGPNFNHCGPGWRA